MRVKRTTLAVGVTLTLVLAACSSASPSAAPSSATGSSSNPSAAASAEASAAGGPVSGGTVVVGVSNDAAKLNSDITTNYPDGHIACMIYEPLVYPKLDGTVDPGLASSWEVSPDGTTYTFHLVDAKWQDGEDFTSADVKYTLENVSAQYSAIFSRVASSIASIDDSDPHTVVVKLSASYGPFLLSLGCNNGGAVLPAHLFDGTDPLTNDASITKPVGTGPFMLKEWAPGDHITLEKNPNYWQAGLPYLDSVIFKVIPNASSRLLALQSGEVQYLAYNQVSGSDYDTIENSSDLYLHDEMFPPPDDLMFFNVRDGHITSNVDVRHALAMATDREFLLNAVWFGIGSVGVSSFDTRVPWANNPDVNYTEMYPFDPTKAGDLLTQAGYPLKSDGTRFSLDFVVDSASSTNTAAAQAIANMWGQIGVTVNVKAEDNATMRDDVFANGNFDVSVQGYTTYSDPALGIVRQFVSSTIGTPFGNASGYSNSEVDQLALEGQSAPTQAQRADYYKQIQVIIAQDLPNLLIHERTAYDAASQRLMDLWHNQVGYGDWTHAWLQP